MKRQALHAASLRLKHPVTGRAFQLIGEFCIAKATVFLAVFTLLCYIRRICCMLYAGLTQVLLGELSSQQRCPLVKRKPDSDEGCCAAAPLPADMSKALKMLNIEAPDFAMLQALL